MAKRDPEVSAELYAMRVKRGWDRDRAANTPPIKDKSQIITVNDEETTVAQARKKASVTLRLYHRRVEDLGWSRVRAATTPPGRTARGDAKTQPTYHYQGKSMSLLAWSKSLGINYRTLLKRMNRGLTFEQAVNHKHRDPLPGRR